LAEKLLVSDPLTLVLDSTEEHGCMPVPAQLCGCGKLGSTRLRNDERIVRGERC